MRLKKHQPPIKNVSRMYQENIAGLIFSKYPGDPRCIKVSNTAPPSDLPATRLEDDSSLPPWHPDALARG